MSLWFEQMIYQEGLGYELVEWTLVIQTGTTSIGIVI